MKWIFSILFLSPSLVHAKNIGYLITRYMAKEYCSCRYVVKQSPKVCKDENKSYKVLVRIMEDEENKVIKVRNVFTTTSAYFVNEKLGCILEKEQ